MDNYISGIIKMIHRWIWGCCLNHAGISAGNWQNVHRKSPPTGQFSISRFDITKGYQVAALIWSWPPNKGGSYV